MPPSSAPVSTESLLARLATVSATALESGALKPLQTEQVVFPDSVTIPGFLVSLLRKHHKPAAPPSSAWKSDAYTKDRSDVPTNPFLPYDRRLYVKHTAPAHVLLLNKFPVVSNHVLLVTEQFEPQSSLLTVADHTALWNVLSQINAVAFYNAGPIAGASQPHKHLQLIPTPLAPTHFKAETPFDRFLKKSLSNQFNGGEYFAADCLPFLHAVADTADIAKLATSGDTDAAGALSMQKYTALLSVLEPQVFGYRSARTVQDDDRDDINVKPFSYNLVITKRFMLAVPRRKERFQGVSVNALGFVGCLLVKDDESLHTVSRVGPMHILNAVALPDDTRQQSCPSIS